MIARRVAPSGKEDEPVHCQGQEVGGLSLLRVVDLGSSGKGSDHARRQGAHKESNSGDTGFARHILSQERLLDSLHGHRRAALPETKLKLFASRRDVNGRIRNLKAFFG
jgi:hypothetical protein